MARVERDFSDFGALRRQGLPYVDKTRLIQKVVDDPPAGLLFLRPPGFGRSLALSSLRLFLERTAEDRASLFQGLEIWRTEAARRHFRRYPVIHLRLHGFEAPDFETALEGLKARLQLVFEELAWLATQGGLKRNERAYMERFLEGMADATDCQIALRELTRFVARYVSERALLLVDDYELPLLEADAYGYLERLLPWYRTFLNEGIQRNSWLFKAILAGQVRIERQRLFSSLDSVMTYGPLGPRYQDCFGMSTQELTQLLALHQASHLREELEGRFGGLLLGGQPLLPFRPVMQRLQAQLEGMDPPATPRPLFPVPGPLWEQGLVDPAELAQLLAGETLEKPIRERFTRASLGEAPEASWSWLMYAGLLKVVETREDEDDRYLRLAIPNLEAHRALAGLKEGLERRSGRQTSPDRALPIADLTAPSTALPFRPAPDAATVLELLGGQLGIEVGPDELESEIKQIDTGSSIDMVQASSPALPVPSAHAPTSATEAPPGLSQGSVAKADTMAQGLVLPLAPALPETTPPGPKGAMAARRKARATHQGPAPLPPGAYVELQAAVAPNLPRVNLEKLPEGWSGHPFTEGRSLKHLEPPSFRASSSAPIPDFPSVQQGFPLVSRAMATLLEASGQPFELLPIRLEDEAGNPLDSHVLLNVLEPVDALDLDRSAYRTWPGTELLAEVSGLVLAEGKLKGRTLLRLSALPQYLFVSRELAQKLLEAGLSGLSFVPLAGVKRAGS